MSEKNYNSIKQKKSVSDMAGENGAAQNERKAMTKVVGNSAKRRKKPLTERIAVAMLGPDGITGVGRYLSHEIVLPAVKDIVVNAFSSGIQMLVYGKESRTTTNYRNSYGRGVTRNRQPVNYQKSYRSSSNVTSDPDFGDHGTGRGTFNSDEYIIDTRMEALQVLDGLKQQLQEYGTVSVADFFDLIGVSTNYTDNNYGWTNLATASIVMVHGGVALRLPPIQDIS